MPKGDGHPSPFGYRSGMRISSCRLEAETASLIVDLLLVIDVTAGSAEYSANRRALSAAEQRAGHCADAGAGRRAPYRLALGVLAIVIIVVIAAVAIASEIVIVVIPGRVRTTSAASVLRHRVWSGGG